MASVTTSSAPTEHPHAGLVAGLTAYILWGFLPLLFKLVEHVGSVTIVADRTLFSLIFVGAILLILRRFGEVRAALADFANVRAMALSAVLLACNWLIYVYAVESHQVLEASFGYFINPIINVAMGMAFLGERQNRMQSIAIAIAIVALVVQAVGLGQVPYIAIGLGLTFALYGFVRKTAKVAATAGLFVETLLLAPVALAYLVFSFATNGPGAHADPQTLFLLALLGPATAVPLLLFNFSIRRLRYTTVGMLQYVSPSIAFILAIVAFGEQLNWVRILSFGLIWVSLIVFTLGSMKRPVPAT